MTGAAERPGFDPRFDPRFQPGYDPVADAVAPPSADGEAADVASGAYASAGRAGPAAPVAEVASVDLPPDEPATDQRHERNEELARFWMLTAWAVALACIVVGFGLFWAANDDVSFIYVGIPTAEEQMLQALGWWLAPPLVEGGIIGVVALLVIGGIRRAQRAGRRTDRG